MMKSIFKFILLYMVFIFNGICDGFKYQIRFFSQKVDHFGYANVDYFPQRYLINLDFYSADNGSIFFYTGNEGDIEMFANNTGFMWENAEYFNAALVFAEHRYYGLSLPYGNLSYNDNKHLGYLTTEQALADFAALITFLKTQLLGGKSAPVIAFGGSYGGMLSAWIRIKYPHLVNGAIASSAPILQFQDLTPCGIFAEIVTSGFVSASFECAKSIRKSWDIIRSMASTDTGSKFLTDTFHLCQSVASNNVTNLINWLSDTWSFMAMTNYPYPTNFMLPIPAHPIKVGCKYLQNSSSSDQDIMLNIYKAASVFQNYTGTVQCFDLTSSGGSSLGEDGWQYQSCTEIVQPMCQTGTQDMFEPSKWNFTAYSETCWKKYGVKPELYKGVLMYGGKNIKSSSNIIFTDINPLGTTAAHWRQPRNVLCVLPLPIGGIHEMLTGYYRCPLTASTKRSLGTTTAPPKIVIHGKLCGNGLLDPWFGGGVLQSLSDSLIAILIEDAAHHLDLRSSNPADPLSVIKARKTILQWINKWIMKAHM